MSTLKARFQFDLIHITYTSQFSVNRIRKIGNHDVLNALFAWQDPVAFARYSLEEVEGGEIFYGIRFGPHYDPTSLVFKALTTTFPFGLVNYVYNEDCLIFEVTEGYRFNIWVAPGKAHMSAQLLQIFLEGGFNDDINNLL